MKRLRCCARFCFWRAPLGPWCCTTCDRTFDGPMPKNAEPRFWAYIDGIVAKLAPLDQGLMACFRSVGR